LSAAGAAPRSIALLTRGETVCWRGLRASVTTEVIRLEIAAWPKDERANTRPKTGKMLPHNRRFFMMNLAGTPMTKRKDHERAVHEVTADQEPQLQDIGLMHYRL
jgi:hypothetical protein